MRQSVETLIPAADGTRLYARRCGEGSGAVVLCDGILCDGFIYKHLWGQLGESLAGSADPPPGALSSVVHWNYRGHGRSSDPADPERVGVDAHAADLLRVCEALGLERVVLVGHSFGVSVVLEAARLLVAAGGPVQVVGLVLIGGTADSVTEGLRVNPALSSMIPRLRQAAEEYPRLVRGVWSRLPSKLASRVALLTGEVNRSSLARQDIQPYFEHLRRLNPQLSVKMLEQASRYSAEGELSLLTMPALVIAGGRDTFIPSSRSQHMAEQLPAAQFVEFSDGTHVCPLEFPDRTRELLEKFLARIPG